MKIHFNLSAAAQSKWYQHAIRFAFGGAMTAAAGVIAKEFGPMIGGLFLAFPAIFPASASLIESHETQKKRQAGLAPGIRGQTAAALDAAGASMGAVGLIVFSLSVWKFLPNHALSVVTIFSTALWFAVSVAIWFASEAL
jgi:hypothetical protein